MGKTSKGRKLTAVEPDPDRSAEDDLKREAESKKGRAKIKQGAKDLLLYGVLLGLTAVVVFVILPKFAGIEFPIVPKELLTGKMGINVLLDKHIAEVGIALFLAVFVFYVGLRIVLSLYTLIFTPLKLVSKYGVNALKSPKKKGAE